MQDLKLRTAKYRKSVSGSEGSGITRMACSKAGDAPPVNHQAELTASTRSRVYTGWGPFAFKPIILVVSFSPLCGQTTFAAPPAH